MMKEMTKEDVLEKITDIFVKEFQMERERIQLSATIFEDLDLDSIDAIDLAVKLDVETGIKLKEEELKAIRTIEDVVEVIHKKIAETAD